MDVIQATTSACSKSTPSIDPSKSLIFSWHYVFAGLPLKFPSICKIPFRSVRGVLEEYIGSIVEYSRASDKSAWSNPNGKFKTMKWILVLYPNNFSTAQINAFSLYQYLSIQHKASAHELKNYASIVLEASLSSMMKNPSPNIA